MEAVESAQAQLRARHQSPVTNHQSLLRPPPLPVIQLVQINLPAQRIPMNSKKASGPRLIAARPVQHPLDEFLFEFVDRFIEVDSTLHHLPDQGFELILHRCTLRTIVVSRPVISAGAFN